MALKNRQGEGGNLVTPTQDKWEKSFDYPVFCFKHLHKDYHLSQCEDEDRIALVNQLVVLSSLTWQEIQYSGRHGAGSEKIKISSMKPKKPVFLTPDVDFLLAIRFSGKKPMIGHRNKFVFHILYLDTKFEAYKH